MRFREGCIWFSPRGPIFPLYDLANKGNICSYNKPNWKSLLWFFNPFSSSFSMSDFCQISSIYLCFKILKNKIWSMLRWGQCQQSLFLWIFWVRDALQQCRRGTVAKNLISVTGNHPISMKLEIWYRPMGITGKQATNRADNGTKANQAPKISPTPAESQAIQAEAFGRRTEGHRNYGSLISRFFHNDDILCATWSRIILGYLPSIKREAPIDDFLCPM